MCSFIDAPLVQGPSAALRRLANSRSLAGVFWDFLIVARHPEILRECI